MKPLRHRLVWLSAGLLLLLSTGIALAATGYEAGWSAFTGGSPAVSAGGYTLTGAAGQTAAGVQGQGGYVLVTGVLAAFAGTAPTVPPPPDDPRIYLPLIQKSPRAP